MNHRGKTAMVLLLVVLTLLATLGLGCGKKSGGKKTIVIGALIDLTGPSSMGVVSVRQALEDITRYYNDENLIPGVRIQLAVYDTQFDPSRSVPGYDWCRAHGAKIITGPHDPDAIALEPFAERDKTPVATISGTLAAAEPPGWVLLFGTPGSWKIKTVLQYVSQQWDYSGQGRKPKLGLVATNDSIGVDMNQAFVEYTQAHPDQFEDVANLLVPLSQSTFTGEIPKVKNCDYVICPPWGTPLASFIREFRADGYTATMLGTDAPPAFRGFVVDYCGWNAVDGMLTCTSPAAWWNDDIPLIKLCKDILQRYHSQDEANKIIYAGSGYVGSFQQFYYMFGVLQAAVKAVGADNFDGQAFYDTAINYSVTYEGYPEFSFSATDVVGPKYGKIYRWSAEAKDLLAVTDWIPLVR